MQGGAGAVHSKRFQAECGFVKLVFADFDACGGDGVMFAVEPFLLRFFGTTPGKWMLGLSVESVDGGRLSLAEARERTSARAGSSGRDLA